MNGWSEIADGVLVRRYEELDLTIGLVVGDTSALVIDTRGDHTQGAELADAVRRVTSLPLRVALTHAHFDHCFGTSAFMPVPIWAHPGFAVHVNRTFAEQRDRWAAHYRENGHTDTAHALATTEPVLPDHVVYEREELDLGGRSVWLRHLGHGHTDHDLIVHVADASVIFAGDLVESAGPPDFEDARPAAWPSTLDRLVDLDPSTVVPGHGDPVDLDFVTVQRNDIAAFAEPGGW